MPVAVSPSCITNVRVTLAFPPSGTLTQGELRVGLSRVAPVTVKHTWPEKVGTLALTVIVDVHVSSPEKVMIWLGLASTIKSPSTMTVTSVLAVPARPPEVPLTIRR